MENITISSGVLTFRGNQYNVASSQKIDNDSFEIHTETETFNFIASETTINGSPVVDIYSLVSKKHGTPNWLGLEQSLFKSALFSKYFSDYNSKGLLLTTVLQNGKAGQDVDQQTLLMGFSALGISWTSGEKTLLNQILTDNNFSIQVP